MATRRTLSLSETEKQALEAVAAHGVKPYQRERAAALLKIASRQSPHFVTRYGLLIARDPDTVYGWLSRYEAECQAKQNVGEGRGRKPAFSPSAPG